MGGVTWPGELSGPGLGPRQSEIVDLGHGWGPSCTLEASKAAGLHAAGRHENRYSRCEKKYGVSAKDVRWNS